MSSMGCELCRIWIAGLLLLLDHDHNMDILLRGQAATGLWEYVGYGYKDICIYIFLFLSHVHCRKLQVCDIEVVVSIMWFVVYSYGLVVCLFIYCPQVTKRC